MCKARGEVKMQYAKAGAYRVNVYVFWVTNGAQRRQGKDIQFICDAKCSRAVAPRQWQCNGGGIYNRVTGLLLRMYMVKSRKKKKGSTMNGKSKEQRGRKLVHWI